MSRRDDDLQREIRQHLKLEAADREADGLPPEEARLAAVRAFGNVTRTREDARAVWIPPWLDAIGQDLGYALRLARRTPAFTLGTILILALGISTSTTMFGALNAVVLAPLPFDRPAELVRLTQTNAARGVDSFSVSLPTFRDWQARSRSFARRRFGWPSARHDGTSSGRSCARAGCWPARVRPSGSRPPSRSRASWAGCSRASARTIPSP